MAIWTRLYEDTNYRGRSVLAALPYEREFGEPSTYLRLPRSFLSSAALHDRISSLISGVSDWEYGGYTILFEHDRYRGRFARFALEPGAPVSSGELSAQNLNDRTSSVLLVRRFQAELGPLALAEFGSPSVRNQVREIAEDLPRSSPRGEPIITWDMWPEFAPLDTFIYVRVPLRIHVPNWFNYDAEARVWVYFYVDSAGKVRGHVAWYGAWVEGGVKRDEILDRIMEAMPGYIPQIDALILALLSPLEPFTFKRLYYLPGNWMTPYGHVEENVSVVLVQEL